MFGAVGTRIRSVERYEVGRDRWVAMDPLPGFRAGCVGFVGGEGGSSGWWVRRVADHIQGFSGG